MSLSGSAVMAVLGFLCWVTDRAHGSLGTGDGWAAAGAGVAAVMARAALTAGRRPARSR
jgi:hypothetical protein